MAKDVPNRVWAVIDGDNNEPLEWHTKRKDARESCAAFNRLEGYEANCKVVEYERRPRA